MYEYDEECLQTFILSQGQLFDEPVAETLECLTKRLKMHQKYLRYQMVVILSLKDKSKKTKVPAGWHRTGHCQM